MYLIYKVVWFHPKKSQKAQQCIYRTYWNADHFSFGLFALATRYKTKAEAEERILSHQENPLLIEEVINEEDV